jgi:hypothetical protein
LCPITSFSVEVRARGRRFEAVGASAVSHGERRGVPLQSSTNATGEDVIGSSRSSGWDAPAHLLARVADPPGVPPSLAHLAPLRYYAEYGRRYASRDLDAFMELFAEGWTMVDHRSGGAEEPIGRGTCRAWTASVFAVSPDVRFTIDDVLACDRRVVAIRTSYRGQGPDGRGEFAFLGGIVTLVEAGHSVHVDLYEYDDDEAMLARYRELTGAP